MKKTVTTELDARGLTAGALTDALADIRRDAGVRVQVTPGDRPWEGDETKIIITETKES